MARFCGLRSSLLRPLLHHQEFQRISPRILSAMVPPFKTLPSSAQITPSAPLSTLTNLTFASLFSLHSIGYRSYSSDSELPSNFVMVKSEDQLNDSLQKVEDESSPAIFYFTAVWCGPCRFLWPHIKNMSETLPDVKFYKIDIDEVGAGPTLSKLNILSVPTLHFFKNGKKADEVVGADPKRIQDIASSLYQE